MTTGTPPGWRVDPGRTDQERWWTGEGWSEHVRPIGPIDFTWAPRAAEDQAPSRRQPRRRSRPRSRRGLIGVVGVVLLAIVGGAALGASRTSANEVPAAPAAASGPGATPAEGRSTAGGPTGTPTSTPGAGAAAGTALAVLATLAVKGRAPMTGYARTADFGAAWLDVDRNGCDTRDDVLRRDLSDTTGSRCLVRSGVLHDPYTGRTIDFLRGERTSEAVQIDHVVPLADAWRTGAQQLTAARRVALANDPINLFAVDGPTNQQKSDGDAATWLPPNKAFRCTYVAHQVGVKRAYGLWVTPAEHAAMERILSTCPTIASPTSTVSDAALPAGATSTSPRPSASATATAAAPGSSSEDPRYSSCSAAEAHGAHTPYVRGKDPEYAWYDDRDGDGVVCE